MSTEQSGNNKSQSMAWYIFECTMSVLYLGLAYILAFASLFTRLIPFDQIRNILAGLFALYGLYRIYRAIKKGICYHKQK
jgi:hypothetical protein